MGHYMKQIGALRKDGQIPRNTLWSKDAAGYEVKSVTAKAVEPLIEVEWDQGNAWNRLCPVDEEGPGDHAYVGCVGVSMAQAMSCYKYPLKGTGSKTYYENTYGTLVVHYDREAPYLWDSMALDAADKYNTRLLYHCAISVGMDFGPDGSSAQTKNIATSLSKYFKYYSGARYVERYASDSSWTSLLSNELISGRPVVYSGHPADGSVGHAFNIDGVDSRGYFHLNWGWSGSYNGYFLINNLRPGSNDFSADQGAVISIRPPVYQPTDLSLTKTSVKEGLPAGSYVARLKITDEAVDNEYAITLSTDSAGMVPASFYLSHDTLLTGTEFLYNEQSTYTLYITVTDTLGHTCNKKFTISILKNTPVGVDDAERGDNLIVYPNPSGGIFYINNSGHRFTDCWLIDLQGHILVRLSHLDESSQIPVNTGGTGTFLLQLREKKGTTITHRVVVH
jgi:hypothetical protein